ncbi:MAG: DUF1684 domain-containing protein [Bacteroidia bacterium]
MKHIQIFLVLVSITASSYAQSYKDEIKAHREKYKQDFLEDDNSPLKKSDLNYLQFFDVDESYKVTASFIRTENAVPFDMPTMNGNKKKYIEYGTLSFQLQGKTCSLKIYQSVSLMNIDEYKDYLFIPFTDKTNGNTTYGGGRYLDFRTGDIKNYQMILDFNKAYNPYCAYSAGYSCPKPPSENALSVKVNAGEKEFGKGTH